MIVTGIDNAMADVTVIDVAVADVFAASDTDADVTEIYLAIGDVTVNCCCRCVVVVVKLRSPEHDVHNKLTTVEGQLAKNPNTTRQT